MKAISACQLLALIVCILASPPAQACCPAPPPGKPAVNADQTVIIIWDAATKTEHFIRKASFKSDADDFGFLVPTPNQPDLNESGNEAFPFLQKLTEPERQRVPRPRSFGLSAATAPAALPLVKVLEEKLVAGFNAAVLETTSADSLINWLKENGYAFSPEIRDWAKPYVEANWKITAFKIAKGDDSTAEKNVSAAALRMSFKTDRPLFPYREPDSRSAAQSLKADKRLLRIYFIADARYEGELTPDNPWSGRVAWANKLTSSNRNAALELLHLPTDTGPAEWWLTEFEDDWPYQVAPADVYFSPSADQGTVKRPPIIEYTSSTPDSQTEDAAHTDSSGTQRILVGLK